MSHHDVVNPAVGYLLMVPMFWNIFLLMRGALKGVHTWEENAKRSLMNAACCLVAGLIAFADQEWPPMWVDAALVAMSLISWWISGGGGRTKKRLKKLKEKFAGKRRTAPQTA